MFSLHSWHWFVYIINDPFSIASVGFTVQKNYIPGHQIVSDGPYHYCVTFTNSAFSSYKAQLAHIFSSVIPPHL